MSQPTPLFQARPLTTNTTNNDTLNKKPLVTCESYTDAYNTSMHQRQLQFFSYLAGFSALLTLLFQSEITFNLYSISNLFSWTTLYYSLLLCISGGIVFFMRFTTITIYEEVYPSVISRILAACVSPDSWTILGLYALSSVITIFSYFSTLVDEEYVNNLFERPTGHYIDVRQLNQKNIFISLYAVLLAAKYTTLYLAKRRHIAKITRVQQPLFYEMRGSMRAILYTSAKEALYVFLTTYIIFIIFSGNIYYRVACAVGVFNRVLDSPIVGFRWVDLYLFTRVILSGTITTTLWNFVNRLFDAIFATTIPVTDAYANQFDCLLNGLTKKDDEVIQATAFNELAQLACKNSKKRVELFSCIGKELQQSVWHRIMTACFQVIGELRMSVDTEYKGIQPVEMPSVPIVKSIEQKPRNRLQFSNDSGLYCTPRKHLNELDDRTGMIFGQVNELIESIPSPTNSPIVQQEKNDALAKINKVISILKTVEIKIGCKGYFSKFYEESRVARIQYVFRKHQLIIWAVQILGSLTAASYKEDSYGYVQNDISNVLNQLLGCFEDVEKYVQKETVAIEEVEAVKKALEEAILQIVIVFNDYLHIFKIDNKYKHIWKRFSCFH